jgi:hypothetical protein
VVGPQPDIPSLKGLIMSKTTVATLDDLLAASRATAEFREAVARLSRHEAPGDRITFNHGAPPVKVLRTITKLLEMEPGLAVDRVHVDAQSGCSDFHGTLTVNDGELIVRFRWDCAWRARQEGFFDHFGYPDQIKAARTFGYQCFEEWVPIRPTNAG